MTQTGKPIVSVILPVYNGSASIEEAIMSVMTQSYSAIELLVINDGSEDNTEEIILKLRQSDSRIRYLKQKNKGVSAARNLGLKAMQGLFFMFLDADDCLTRESITSRMLKFQRDSSLAFCDGAVTVFDHSLKIPKRFWRPTERGVVFKKLVRLNEGCFFGPTWLIKRDYCVTYSFEEDMTHAEDLFFFMVIAKYGKYDFVDQEVLKYRTSQNSAMRNLKGLANGYNTLLKKTLHRFGNEITFGERVYLWIKIRVVMALSFLGAGYPVNAFTFLLTGKVK